MTATIPMPYCMPNGLLQSWPLAMVLIALIVAGLIVWTVKRADKRDNNAVRG